MKKLISSPSKNSSIKTFLAAPNLPLNISSTADIDLSLFSQI